MEWLTSDTAPRDGTPFIGWNKSHGQHECFVPNNVAHYKKLTAVYGVRTSNSNTVWFTPTHWMRLPDPPE